MTLLKKCTLTAIGLALVSAPLQYSNAATIAADGGITLYLSYDDANTTTGENWNDAVTQTTSGCAPTNTARSNMGAPASPGSCISGNSCAGKEKVTGDLQAFAEYIYQSTEGEHYLRRVYLSNQGRAWNQADIKWSIGTGSSSSPQGWQIPFSGINMRNTRRTCIHDVLHHEFGHYFYNLPDRYARSDGYYQGTLGGPQFSVSTDVGDPNTVMSSNFPHFFVDTTNAEITVSYDPGTGAVNGEVLTPALLADSDPNNDGPNRAHHGHTSPFAQDEWSLLPSRHADLSGVHTEGNFPVMDFASMPTPELIFLGEDEPHPGTVLLLDRSGSMGVSTNGITAAQFVQEAGMFLYHSSLPDDYVGTLLYNGSVETLFPYDEYDPSNTLPFASFRPAVGLTNIADAIKTGVDALIAEHGTDGAHGGKIVLMSDGKQTTGPNLWNEVTNAEEKGIEIHTLSFGNADTATMEAIASTTGGDVIEMSEVTDGSELKLGMARELSELRGMTPIHFTKQVLEPNSKTKAGAVYQGTFNVPPTGRALQFYSFLATGNAAEYPLELVDPNGNLFVASPTNVAHKGRLNGVTVKQPTAGQWQFRIHGSKRLRGNFPGNDPFELLAYTQDLNLSTSVSITPSTTYKDYYLITAQIAHAYPLMGVNTRASINIGNARLVNIPLYDNGKDGVDTTKADGIYSGLIHSKRLSQFPKVRVDVEFNVTEKSRPATYAHYETGTKVEEITEEYKKYLKSNFTTFATETFSLRDKSRQEPVITTVKPSPTIPVKPGSKGKISVVVANAFLSEKTLRATLGQGISVEILSVDYSEKGMQNYVTLAYRVGDIAYNGERELVLQANVLTVKKKAVLHVEGGKDYGPAKGDSATHAHDHDKIKQLIDSIEKAPIVPGVINTTVPTLSPVVPTKQQLLVR